MLGRKSEVCISVWRNGEVFESGRKKGREKMEEEERRRGVTCEVVKNQNPRERESSRIN